MDYTISSSSYWKLKKAMNSCRKVFQLTSSFGLLKMLERLKRYHYTWMTLSKHVYTKTINEIGDRHIWELHNSHHTYILRFFLMFIFPILAEVRNIRSFYPRRCIQLLIDFTTRGSLDPQRKNVWLVDNRKFPEEVKSKLREQIDVKEFLYILRSSMYVTKGHVQC